MPPPQYLYRELHRSHFGGYAAEAVVVVVVVVVVAEVAVAPVAPVATTTTTTRSINSRYIGVPLQNEIYNIKFVVSKFEAPNHFDIYR